MGIHSNHPVNAVLTSTHNLCFDQKYENHQILFSEKFHFLLVKFSVYLNRHVFVMIHRAALSDEFSKLCSFYLLFNVFVTSSHSSIL